MTASLHGMEITQKVERPEAMRAVALQVENEYGYCGSDSSYIRHLVQVARGILGDDVILYTTDPPTLAAAGSLPGKEVYT